MFHLNNNLDIWLQYYNIACLNFLGFQVGVFTKLPGCHCIYITGTTSQISGFRTHIEQRKIVVRWVIAFALLLFRIWCTFNTNTLPRYTASTWSVAPNMRVTITVLTLAQLSQNLSSWTRYRRWVSETCSVSINGLVWKCHLIVESFCQKFWGGKSEQNGIAFGNFQNI